MTATDRLPRLAAIGAHLARSAPALVVALIAFLDSIVRALDAAVIARPDREDTSIASGDDGALHELLQRLIGWSPARHGEVDRAGREVREMAAGREAVILLGEGSLVGVARRLHRITLGDRPLVVLARGEPAAVALDRAAGGLLYIGARDLPPDLDQLATVPADVRIVVGAETVEESARIAAMLPRVAMISIPPLRERSDEIERLLEAYGSDAVTELGAPDLGFRRHDLEWARANPSWIATLAEIEDVARRLVVIRTWGVTDGAARLGVTHGALSRWARRRGIPTTGGAP